MDDRDSTGGSAFAPDAYGGGVTRGGSTTQLPDEPGAAGFAEATFANVAESSFSGATYPTDPVGGSMGQGQGQGQGMSQAQGMGGDQGGSATDKAKEMAGQAQEKATEAVDTAKEKAGQAAEQASDKVDTGIDKAATGLSSLAGTLRERGEGMGDGGAGGAVGTAATATAERLDAASQYLQNKDTDQLMADLEDLVRRKPAQSLLAAAGIGFLLSKALR